jgi:hypothetical protein
MLDSQGLNKNTFLSARVGGLSRSDMIELMKHAEVIRRFRALSTSDDPAMRLSESDALAKAMDAVYSGSMTRDISRSMNPEGNLWRVYVEQDPGLVEHMRRIVTGNGNGITIRITLPELASIDVFLNDLPIEELYTARVAEANGQNPEGKPRPAALAKIDRAIHNSSAKVLGRVGRKKATEEDLADLAQD